MDEGSSSPRSFLTKLSRVFRKNSPATFEEEITDLVDHGAESGLIPKSAGDMIQSIVEFSDTVARKIMTPRIAMVGVEVSATIGEVIRILQAEGYSRLPVYEGDMDHIKGFLVGKDLLQFWGQPLDTPLPPEVVRPAVLVPGNKKIGDILSELRLRKNHLAVVLDEYGGTAGLVTMEDIIEEIVGDIHDEYDEEENAITCVGPGVTLVSGQAAMEDLSEHLGKELPEGDYDTLGGFLTNLVGRVPCQDEVIAWEDLRFTIQAADNRKVDLVEVQKASPGDADPGAAEPSASPADSGL